ncbi:hypothetical protein CSHISOI_06388 [Colletotrichum shisoi]|uniref:Uncharacterized protein n=1 Tax=Colletotrichum shisoi TaxID=2078593 RepID=A0A5Q4BQ39_9PEZI|nr:hypothetical protein CSHISOI_06388 [Colletotrichum shisoi]
MLLPLFIAKLRNPLRLCEGSPTFQENHRVNYVPNLIDAGNGPQIVAPDKPYVAAAGRNQLYSIETRLDPETAKHIKEQIQWAIGDGPTNETLFVFGPQIRQGAVCKKESTSATQNFKPPEHEPAGDWLVAYDVDNPLTKRTGSCYNHGCNTRKEH